MLAQQYSNLQIIIWKKKIISEFDQSGLMDRHISETLTARNICICQAFSIKYLIFMIELKIFNRANVILSIVLLESFQIVTEY